MSESAPVCVDCAKASPDANTAYSLISRTGWRLTRGQTSHGRVVMEWRCPDCWVKRKRKVVEPRGRLRR